jgi:PAS domain S-box-containing protein
MNHVKKKVEILIVEDEVLIVSDLESRIKRLGYEVCGSAVSAEKAMEIVERRRPDLVIMDIVLQGEMDGIDAARQIRDRWNIPVVFLTAYADPVRLERAKLTYPFGYLLKPFQDIDLKVTLEMALFAAQVENEKRQNRRELQKYKQIVSSTRDGVSYLDRQYRYQIVNDAYELFAGRPKSEIIGQTIGQYLGENLFQTKIKDHFDQCLTGRTVNYREWFDYPALGRRFVSVTFSPYIDPDGHIEGVVAVTRDITDQRLTEEALAESEGKYRQLFQHAPSAIYEIDLAANRLLDVNDVACEHLGYERDELMAIKPFELLGRDSRRLLKRGLESEIVEAETPRQLECEMIRRDGRRLWVMLTARFKYIAGRAASASVVVHDITRRKMMEDLARKNEERFRLIANNSVDSAFFHDDRLQYTWITKAFDPFAIDEIMGKTDLDLLADEHGRGLYEFKREVLESGEPKQAEFIIPLGDGSLSYYEITVSPRTGLDGRVTGLSGFMRNITARREAEAEIRRREAQLQEERKNLEEANAAFKLLLKHRDEELQRQKEDLVSNIKNMALPYFDRLKSTKLDQAQQDLIGIIESSLGSLLPGWSSQDIGPLADLTPKELEVSNLIKMGRSSKQIAELLDISDQTVAFHRKNIRRKLGLTDKGQNLRTCLMRTSQHSG